MVPLASTDAVSPPPLLLQGGHLLNHDDVIGTRAVSFIIYLTDPDEAWTAEDGGALELYPLVEGGGWGHRGCGSNWGCMGLGRGRVEINAGTSKKHGRQRMVGH